MCVLCCEMMHNECDGDDGEMLEDIAAAAAADWALRTAKC